MTACEVAVSFLINTFRFLDNRHTCKLYNHHLKIVDICN